MKALTLLVVLLFGKIIQCNITTAASATKAVADWFHVPCIAVFHANHLSDEQESIYRILKVMYENDSLKLVSVNIFKLKGIPYRYDSRRCPQMLHVVYGRYTILDLEKLSANTNLGGPIWVVFLPHKISVEEYLRYVYIPFNANFIAVRINEFTATLYQVYRVSRKHPLRSSKMADWTYESGLTISNGYLPYWRRDDFEGIEFRVSATDSWPLAVILPDNSIGGYFGKLWLDLQEKLNFTTTYVPTREYANGVWDGIRWNGLVGMIVKKRIDVAISDVTITTDRLSAVDFLIPLYATRYQLFFKPPGLMIQWDLILRPFRPEVWVTLLTWLTALTTVLIIGYRLGQRYSLEDPKYKWEYESYHCLFFIMSAFTLQGNTIMPKSSSCRIILATAYLFSSVIVILYSCMLTSMIAIQKPSRPFDSLESFLEDGTYVLEQIPGSDGYTYFSNSTDPVLQEIYHKQFSRLMDDELPKSHKSAIKRICGKSKIAHLGEFGVTQIIAKDYIENKGCDIIYLQKPLNLVHLTIAITKDSPYKEAFDHQLSMMAVSGILNRFQNRNFPLTTKSRKISFNAVRVEQVAQVNTLLAMGVLASLLVLVGELLLHSSRRRR